MSKYGNGFTLAFVYCKNCGFHNANSYEVFELTDDIKKTAESAHQLAQNLSEEFYKKERCQKRELVISYNRAMVEKT